MLETNTPSPVAAQSYPFEFRGNGKEYFKIWIVNVGLTILTLGIYSAWAKVRTRRYFYNHMFVNGQSFDYHADPIKILKGRIMLFLIGLSVALVNLSPIFLIIPVLFFLAGPYLIVRGAIFNFTNTSFRGVRFGFQRAYQESYITWLKAIAVTIFTLGIGALTSQFYWRKFIFDHMALGKARFKLGGTGFEFWAYMMKVFFLYGLGFLAIYLGVTFGLFFSGLISKEDAGLVPFLLVAMIYVFYGFLFVVYQVRTAHFYSKHTSGDGGLGFQTRLTLWDSFLMYAEQLFLLIITLGFAWPWVTVAIAKYKAEHTDAMATPEFFNSLEQAQLESVSAFGEEVASFWDFDIGF